MTHGEASPLVSDWARGALDETRASAVERHVRECVQCQDAAAAARALDSEAGRIRSAPQRHPSSDTLARYVVVPDDEPIASLAQIAVHLHGCDDCRGDVVLMREASAPGWWRSIRASLGTIPLAPRMLQPALAAGLLLLVVPAWNGLVDAPRERATSAQLLRDAEEGRARAESEARELASRASEPERGGGVAALVLRGATRAGEEKPSVRLRAGQRLQPLLLDVVPPPGALAIRLMRESGGEAWSVAGPREEFWDDSNRLVGVLVPAEVLPPGDYRLELASSPGAAAFFSSSFQVAAPAGD